MLTTIDVTNNNIIFKHFFNFKFILILKDFETI